MLNNGKLFLNLLCDELTNEYNISKESFNVNTTGEGLKNVLDKKGNLSKFGLTSNDVIEYRGENLGTVYEDDSAITNFMVNEIIDKGSKEEKQLIYKYIQAKENLAHIEDVLNSRVKSYKDSAKEFYTGINDTSSLIAKYLSV